MVDVFSCVVETGSGGTEDPIRLVDSRSPVTKGGGVVEVTVVLARIEHHHAGNSAGFVTFCLVEVRVVLQVASVDQGECEYSTWLFSVPGYFVLNGGVRYALVPLVQAMSKMLGGGKGTVLDPVPRRPGAPRGLNRMELWLEVSARPIQPDSSFL
eukprot:136577-Heterocapsa_arctica.AAC.1